MKLKELTFIRLGKSKCQGRSKYSHQHELAPLLSKLLGSSLDPSFPCESLSPAVDQGKLLDQSLWPGSYITDIAGGVAPYESS